MRLEIGEDAKEILPDEMRQHEPVVQRGAPARQRPIQRIAPQPGENRPDQELLSQAHAGVRRHLEAAELDEAKPARRPIGRIELVDADFRPMGVAGDVGQKIAHEPVEQPRPRRGAVSGLRDLGERDLQLVKTVVTRFVDTRRLAGRPDEQAGEEVAQARAAQPMDEEALEQVGAPEERTVERRLAADDDMIAPAGPRMLAVDHELVGAEARKPRFFVDNFGGGDAFAPARRGMDIDFDHAGIGRDANDIHARIDGGRVAFDLHRKPDFFGGRLGGCDQFEIILEPLDRRQEHA